MTDVTFTNHEQVPYHHPDLGPCVCRLCVVARERDRLQALLEEYAKHADYSGWSNLAAEIRRRAKGET